MVWETDFSPSEAVKTNLTVPALLVVYFQEEVAAVAAACGFSSHAYFSKTFYRLRGAHPSDLLVREEK
jgi:transcriptional regulator GlxA family with amidase domain